MLRKLLLLSFVSYMMYACELGERLDVRYMGESPGYFVECYCRPDSMFEMTATKIAPVSEPQVLDYSIQFDAYIYADEPVKMFHSFFQRPGTNFIYNYASSKRLNIQTTDSLRLELKTSEGALITAVTRIPEAVRIDSVLWVGDNLLTYFTSHADSGQNYYILTYSWLTSHWNSKTFFLKGYSANEPICHDYFVDKDSVSLLNVSLKRMTQEGYRYQYSLDEAKNSGNESLFTPVELLGNISGAMGIFTCYTEDRKQLCLQ